VSRYKVDRSCELIPGYKFDGGHWRSVAVQTISKPEICQGAEIWLRADARFAHRSRAKVGVRVQRLLQICLECRSTCLTAARLADGHSDRQAGRKAKSVTTVPAVALAKAGQLTHIVRVRQSDLFRFITFAC